MNQPEEWNQPEDLNQPDESFADFGQHADFGQQLTQALHRVAPPDGFTERVMARTQSSMPARAKAVTMTPRPGRWAGGAIAATLLVGLFAAERTHIRRQREQAELAQRQFEVAIRITDETLEQTRQQLQRAGIELGN